MARQSATELNEAQRKRYAKRTGEASNLRDLRNMQISKDRFIERLSLRQIAAKRGVSVGLVRGVLAKGVWEKLLIGS